MHTRGAAAPGGRSCIVIPRIRINDIVAVGQDGDARVANFIFRKAAYEAVGSQTIL